MRILNIVSRFGMVIDSVLGAGARCPVLGVRCSGFGVRGSELCGRSDARSNVEPEPGTPNAEPERGTPNPELRTRNAEPNLNTN